VICWNVSIYHVGQSSELAVQEKEPLMRAGSLASTREEPQPIYGGKRLMKIALVKKKEEEEKVKNEGG
jgi:hypothetical protein